MPHIRDFELDDLPRAELNQRQLTHHWLRAGNLDTVIHTQVDDFFQREVSLLARVEAGQRLGVILDPSGAEKSAIEAHQDDVVIMLRGIPRVQAGDGIAHIARSYRPPV